MLGNRFLHLCSAEEQVYAMQAQSNLTDETELALASALKQDQKAELFAPLAHLRQLFSGLGPSQP